MDLELRVPIKNEYYGDVLQAINKAIDLSEKNIKVLLLETKQISPGARNDIYDGR
jgi:hypothetical protein